VLMRIGQTDEDEDDRKRPEKKRNAVTGY
jgi:hypothetical protein